MEFIVPDAKVPERLDKFLNGKMKNVSRNKIQNLIDHEFVTVNDKSEKVNYKVKPKDVILVDRPRSKRVDIVAEDIDIDVVYSDKYIAVINKQAGLVVHPTYFALSGTLVNALMYRFKDELSSVNGDLRPGIVHRLDKDTTGLMVIAKNDLAHKPLADQFADKSAGREYIGVCIGKFKEKSGRIETLLTRWQRDRRVIVTSEFEGKNAVTNYEVLEEFNRFTIAKFKLETGRTHQIRAHMKHINHPLFGDPVYNGTNLPMLNMPKNQQKRLEGMLDILPRQALHAKKLSFVHPVTKERMSFETELPDDMKKIIELIKLYEY